MGIELVSVSSGGVQGNSNSYSHGGTLLSADGRFVTFYSYANNLVAGDTNDRYDIFVHDRQTDTTERVSVATGGTQGNSDSYEASISADGRFVTFWSHASNLVAGDSNGSPDIFVHDRQTDTTERVSVATGGTQGNSESYEASISADGRFVTFRSLASNLVAGDNNGAYDIFVHDRQTDTTERVSIATGGAQGNDGSVDPSISADGRFVTFYSYASNLVAGDSNGIIDIFVHDRQAGTTQRISVSDDGVQGNTNSFVPSISADGKHVAFFSYATNLVPGDANGATDVFVWTNNDAPVAQDDALSSVAEDSGQRSIAFSALTGNDQDVDGDTLTVTGVSAAVGGTASISGSNVLFTPTANFSGEASFTYTVSDGHGGTDTAVASFDVNPANDAPVAGDDAFTTGEKVVLSGVNVITNPGGADSDIDGDTLTVTGVGADSGNVGVAVAGSNGGLFTIQANGNLAFAPGVDFEALNNGQTATTSIAYTVADGHGGTDSATVTVTVNGAAEADLFTAGDDTRDLNAYNLDAFTNAQVTRALGGKDIVQLSQTQKLGMGFEAGAGNDTVTGSSSTDRIHGDGGKDRIHGENGDDSLWGDGGDDSLVGGNGHDQLHGGEGWDTLTGGNGNDLFVFEDAGTAASPQRDAITDFAFGVAGGNKDAIDLRAFDLADWTGSDSQVTVTGSGSSRTIYVDLNNDHNAANNTTQAEVVLYVNAPGGIVRNFVISDVNPLADILV